MRQQNNWSVQNRFVEIAAGWHQQNYTELDQTSITKDGVLDSETGTQEQLSVGMRWQSMQGMMLQLEMHSQSGATDYQGYLQNGNGSLTSYRARTGNVARKVAMQIGYALNTSSIDAIPYNWQVVPIAQIGLHDWQRNLVQYSEHYRYSTWAVGVMFQWQMQPSTSFELQALGGQSSVARVNVKNFNFSAEQAGDQIWELQIAVSQNLERLFKSDELHGWHLNLKYGKSFYAHSASPISAGLQAPSNQQRSRILTLGLQKQF